MKKKFSRKVKVCPVRNSQDISLFNILKFEQRCAFFRDVCNNCNYIGPMTIMKRKDADKLKVLKLKKLKRK